RRPRERRPRRTRGDAVALLALRRRGVGGRVPRRLRGGTVMGSERFEGRPGTILVPGSTAAPLFTAVGVTLLLAGLVTNASVSAVGVVLFAVGAVGWFREVLPDEHE